MYLLLYGRRGSSPCKFELAAPVPFFLDFFEGRGWMYTGWYRRGSQPMNVEYTKISQFTSCGKRTPDRERKDCKTICTIFISVFSHKYLSAK